MTATLYGREWRSLFVPDLPLGHIPRVTPPKAMSREGRALSEGGIAAGETLVLGRQNPYHLAPRRLCLRRGSRPLILLRFRRGPEARSSAD